MSVNEIKEELKKILIYCLNICMCVCIRKSRSRKRMVYKNNNYMKKKI